MHDHGAPTTAHDHIFGQDRVRAAEKRTLVVVVLTVAMMVVEIAAGLAFGSMALLADGLHMGSHATALGIALIAYRYARRHAGDSRYSFGTGKVNSLGGYTGAVLLVVFALLMAWESVHRLIRPVPISFNQAMVVAALGLVVNGFSALVLGHEADEADGAHVHGPGQPHEHDHNLRSAYLHVLADALTSVTAIVALACGKLFGWAWMDPLMGIVGSLVVSRWAVGLLRGTAAVLLDRQAPAAVLDRVRAALQAEEGVRVVDLHVWSIGPSLYAATVSVEARDAEQAHRCRARLSDGLGLAHVTVEAVMPTHPQGSAPPVRQ